MHCTGKNSQHSSIVWPAWLNGWVFVYELIIIIIIIIIIIKKKKKKK